MLRYALVAGFAILYVGVHPATAHEVKIGTIALKHPWGRAFPQGQTSTTGAVKIANKGEKPDRLIGASLEGATGAELHVAGTERPTSFDKAGVTIAPGETVELETKGTHLVFRGFSKPLTEESYVDGTLVFERAGTVTLEFFVEPAVETDQSRN